MGETPRLLHQKDDTLYTVTKPPKRLLFSRHRSVYQIGISALVGDADDGSVAFVIVGALVSITDDDGGVVIFKKLGAVETDGWRDVVGLGVGD